MASVRIDHSDVDLFAIRDSRKQVQALQEQLHPKLKALCEEALARVEAIYHVDLDFLTQVARPSNRNDAESQILYDEAYIGVSLERQKTPLAMKSPDGKDRFFSPTYLYFRVTPDGELQTVLLWYRQRVEETYRRNVRELIESHGDPLLDLLIEEGVFTSPIVNDGPLSASLDSAGCMWASPPLPLPLEEGDDAWNRAIAYFAVFFPLAQAAWRLSLGEPPILGEQCTTLKALLKDVGFGAGEASPSPPANGSAPQRRLALGRDVRRRGGGATLADPREEIHTRITRSDRRKITMKIRTLMEQFGFTATQRVRQTSLSEVLTALAERGIAHHFPGGTSAFDYVTLSEAEALLAVDADSSSESRPGAEALGSASSPAKQDVPAGRRACDDSQFDAVLAWLATFAGSPDLATTIDRSLVDMAGMFSEACRLQESAMARLPFDLTDTAFRAGSESTEHMVLKNLAIADLRRRFPNQEILVEEASDGPDDAPEDDETRIPTPDQHQRDARPDIRVPDQVWVEVETLRWIARAGSSPFFELERKLRQKLGPMTSCKEAWIVLPTDIPLLALDHVSAVARNLQEVVRGTATTTFRIAFPDLQQRTLLFLPPARTPPPKARARLSGASWREARRPAPDARVTWQDVAGYSSLKQNVTQQVLEPLQNPQRYTRHGLGGANGLLLFGLPGCGKSRVGRVLAGEAGIICRRLAPSDLTSKWIGEGVEKIREIFDWAAKQPACLLVIDEIDALAPQRKEHNMHADEKRQVNELLAQLDRISGKPIVVVGTTNYVSGIDTAVRRSGRFDVKLPVLPPTKEDREQILRYYLNPTKHPEVQGFSELDLAAIAETTPLFTPADIKSMFESLLRRLIGSVPEGTSIRVSTADVVEAIDQHPRSIQRDQAEQWLIEASGLGVDRTNLQWLDAEIRRAYPA